jgi:hypothetical protein
MCRPSSDSDSTSRRHLPEGVTDQPAGRARKRGSACQPSMVASVILRSSRSVLLQVGLARALGGGSMGGSEEWPRHGGSKRYIAPARSQRRFIKQQQARTARGEYTQLRSVARRSGRYEPISGFEA